jgi:DNA-binding MurR/RpiR family transcriptional regulator
MVYVFLALYNMISKSHATSAPTKLTIESVIKKDWKKFTASEQRLATFFLQHLEQLPFETAASIAKRLAVSPMTVGRFLKKIGFDDLRGVKAALRSRVPESGWLSSQITKTLFEDAPLNAKIKALTDAHRVPLTAEWPRIVSLLATASKINIASFQLGRFLGLGFASALHTIRANVHFSDGGDGAYIDALLDSDPGSCLVLLDWQRYSQHFRLLAEEAAARQLTTVIITDTYCHWAREITDHVLMLETGFDSSWERLSIAQTLLELLLVDVAKRVKGRKQRYEAIHELRKKFVGFSGPENAP